MIWKVYCARRVGLAYEYEMDVKERWQWIENWNGVTGWWLIIIIAIAGFEKGV